MEMNLFDMLGNFGIEAPVVEKKEEPKTEKKETPKTEKKAVVKNSVKLPGTAIIQNWGKVDLTAESLEVEGDSADNTKVEEYIKRVIPCAKAMSFSYEGNTVICDYSGYSVQVDIEEGDTFYMNGLELDLSDVADSSVKTDVLFEHLNSNGFSIPKGATLFKKDDVIMPVLTNTSDKDIEGGLMYPVTIHMAGSEDITVAGVGKVTSKALAEGVVKVYPGLKGKVKFTMLDKALNSVWVNIQTSSTPTSTEKTYKIKPTSVIKWEGYYTMAHELDGEYTLKEICEYFKEHIPENDSEGLHDYFSKKNCADKIDITPHKEFDLFYISLKGGRKGAAL